MTKHDGDRHKAQQGSAGSGRAASGADGQAKYCEYAAVLSQQRALLGELDALSQRLTLLIDEPAVEPLLAVLDERQSVIDQIMRAQRTVETLRPQWEQVRGTVPAQHQALVQDEAQAVVRLAKEIADRDEKDHNRLKKRLEGVTSELAGMATMKRATGAYSPVMAPSPKFQDRRA